MKKTGKMMCVALTVTLLAAMASHSCASSQSEYNEWLSQANSLVNEINTARTTLNAREATANQRLDNYWDDYDDLVAEGTCPQATLNAIAQNLGSAEEDLAQADVELAGGAQETLAGIADYTVAGNQNWNAACDAMVKAITHFQAALGFYDDANATLTDAEGHLNTAASLIAGCQGSSGS